MRTGRLLDAVEDGAPLDFVRDIAGELPMQMICLLLGIPEVERHWLFEAIEPGFDYRGSRKSFEPDVDAEAVRARMAAYGNELIAEKRRHSGDDMLSIVVHATLDDAEPPCLTDGELYMFFSLLFSAGADTTRNAIAGGVLALAEHPAQLERLRTDKRVMPTAVEEILRWTTPSPSKRRTATRPTELGGHAVAAGDKVLVWEGSANRDDLVFDRADQFDITRDPNPHLGFGFGLHYCLGASLARLEIRVVLEELLPRFPGIRVVEPVEWTRSNRHTGFRHLMVELDRRLS